MNVVTGLQYRLAQHSSSIHVDETFKEKERVLWPALFLMRHGREHAPVKSLVAEVLDLLRVTRSLSGEDLDLGTLASPVPALQIIDWLHAVWHRLGAGAKRDFFDRRRSILEGILASSLSDEDKARFVTALDYLARLSAVRNVKTQLPAVMPTTQHPAMQKAYRRLAAFAATDLPVWLAGEPGTELRWAAQLIHNLRGGPDNRFKVWSPSQDGLTRTLRRFIADKKTGRARLTLMVRDVDQAGEDVQRQLHDTLLDDLRSPGGGAIIVTTQPLHLNQGPATQTCLELFAFLAPTRVDIPPLRQRITDLPMLMDFFAISLSRGGLAKRMTPEASKVLAAYHWPGNTEELESVVAYLAKRRPSGPIRLEDLPDTIAPESPREESVLVHLERLHNKERARVLSTDSARRTLARFLDDHRDTPFDAVEFQAAFRLGRETARRLLQCLMEYGLVTGIKGPQGKRTTRYRGCNVADRLN